MRTFEDAVTVFIGLIFVGGTFLLASDINNNYHLFSNGSFALVEGLGGGHFKTEKDTHNFGRVSSGSENISHIFSVKNISDKDLMLSKIYTSSDILDAFIKMGEFEAGPFNIRDYLFSDFSGKKLEKGGDFYIKVVLKQKNNGPLGLGLTEPFAVVEDISGGKIVLKVSALVFP